MVLLESLPLSLGQTMPAFELKDASGEVFSSTRAMGEKGLLVAFTCNHCPYALAIWPRLVRLSEYASGLGVGTVAINPNIHPDYPEDSPEKMLEKSRAWGIPFPYLVDKDQQVARLYQAQCTPDLYLLDPEYRLIYHGRMDDNWKDEKAVSRHELKAAIECLSEGEPLEFEQAPAMGCSIKWRSSHA